MACLVTNGIERTCGFVAGGVSKVWIANFDEIASYTETSGVITTITMDAAALFYPIDPIKDTASYTEALSVNGGQKAFQQTVTFSLSPRHIVTDAAAAGTAAEELVKLRALVDNILLGKFVVILKNRSEQILLFGKGNGLETTEYTANSGATGADDASYVVTMTSFEVESAAVVSAESVIPIV